MSGFIAAQQKLKQAYSNLSSQAHQYQFYDFIIFETLAKTPRLTTMLNWFFANNPALNQLLETNNTTLELYKDANSDAKALMFGVLIKACIAIRRDTPQKMVYSSALERILSAAHELEAKYQCGWSFQAINFQSGQFVSGYVSLIYLINAILSQQISVTELILQVNKECLLAPLSPLNAALADLSRFILWRAGESYINHFYPTVIHEADKAKLIRPCTQNLSELLEDQVRYSELERALICDWLGINCYVIHIVKGTNVFLEKAGTVDLASPFTLVIRHQQTSILFDNTMRVQILNEMPFRSYFHDPEMRFENLQLTHLILEQKLDVLKAHFEELCTESFRRVTDQTWQIHYLTDLYNYFIKSLRPLVFHLTSIDNMSEWECHLHELLRRMENKSHLREFVNYIGERLQVIYRGEFPSLLNSSTSIHLNISFRSAHKTFICSLNNLIVPPKEYQTLLILVQGIQRIHLDTCAEFETLKSQLDLLSCYLFYILSIECIPQKFCNKLKNKVAEFFNSELHALEQNDAQNQASFTLIRQEFIEVLNVIEFENPAEALNRREDQTKANMLMHSQPAPLQLSNTAIVNETRCCFWTLFRSASPRVIPVRHQHPSNNSTSMHHKNGT